MFKNYLKIGWRNLWKDYQLNLLNLSGLALGLACSILVYFWVKDELGVDQFHENADRLYQVMKNSPGSGGILTMEDTPGMLADALARKMPEVEYAVAAIPAQKENRKGIFTIKDNNIEAADLCVGKDFFKVFSFQLIQGDRDNVLAGTNDIVISDELATKLFHTTDNIVGNTVEWSRPGMDGIYKVSGVFRKVPVNSSLQFDVLFNYQHYLGANPKLLKWNNFGPSTFVVLKKGSDIDALNRKIGTLIQENSKSKATLFAQKFSDRYLHGQYENGVPAGGRISYVRLFSIIAVFIMVIACINFMNLSTARAMTRLKEVGVKKTMGATRRSLIIQYMIEALLITFLGLLLAIIPILLILPGFNQLTGKQLSFSPDPALIGGVLGITILTGLIAGSYPALYISGFKPATILSGRTGNLASAGELFARRGLVTFQFVISVVLIISVIVVYKQTHLIQTKNLGYARDHVIWFARKEKADSGTVQKDSAARANESEAFLHDVRNTPGVISAANFRHNIAAGRDGFTTAVDWEGKRPEEPVQFTDIVVGYDFINTMGITLKEGRAFSKDFGDERSKIIFNETAIRTMGLKDPIGRKVRVWNQDMEIIGVAKDFHFQSLYEPIKPCFFYLNQNQSAPKIIARIQAGMEKETIDRLQRVFRQYNQGLPFEYRYLDEDYQVMYAAEKRVEVLSKYFAAIAIFISCLGLFGLAAFTAQRRQKEIGIRKVIGASVSSIVILLCREFLRLVLIAVLVAFPIAWWVTSRWLDKFTYRIQIGWEIFLLSAIATVLITLGTVMFQSMRAARANPIRVLGRQ